jgi:diguanylate cyclase (GGDEF)-like protein/PAS domain S-box-containing protein
VNTGGSDGETPGGLDTTRVAGLDALADAVVVIDAAGAVRWANAAAERIIGERLAEWLGRSGLELVHPQDLTMAIRSLESIQAKQAGTPVEMRLATPAGWRLMEVLGSRLDDDHVVLVLRDLTERRRWEVAGDDVARFRSVVHNAATLTALLRRDGTVTSVSAAVTRKLGHDPEEVCGRPFADLVADDDREAFAMALHQAVHGTQPGADPVAIEVDLCSRLDVRVPFELTVVSLLDDPTAEGLVISGHDITRLRIAQDALTELATYDSLTGLLNRRSFEGALEREWLLSQRDGIDSFVAVVDLNRFKQLNDRHGHSAGDEALRQVARALHAVVRTSDILGRLGGDEFACLLVRCGGEATAIGFRARLEEELERRPWPHGSTMTAAVGYQSLKRSESPSHALHQADVAMFDAKRALQERQGP